MFKAGEKVIHHRFGEGVLMATGSTEYPLLFLNKKGRQIPLTIDGKEHEDDIDSSIFYVPQTHVLSHSDHNGIWGYFWDFQYEACIYGKLIEVAINEEYKYTMKFADGSAPCYKHFSPEIPPHIKELMNGTATSNT